MHCNRHFALSLSERLNSLHSRSTVWIFPLLKIGHGKQKPAAIEKKKDNLIYDLHSLGIIYTHTNTITRRRQLLSPT